MTLDLSKLEYVIFDWDNTLAESRSTTHERFDKETTLKQ